MEARAAVSLRGANKPRRRSALPAALSGMLRLRISKAQNPRGLRGDPERGSRREDAEPRVPALRTGRDTHLFRGSRSRWKGEAEEVCDHNLG